MTGKIFHLAYNIIDFNHDVDNHLIRDLLMHYVAQHGNTLQLEAGGAAEPLEQQPSKR